MQEGGHRHCKWAAKGTAWRWARDKSLTGWDHCSKICQKHPVHSRLEMIKSNPLAVLILPFISQPRDPLENRVSKPPSLVRDDVSACLCHTGMPTQGLHFQWHGSGDSSTQSPACRESGLLQEGGYGPHFSSVFIQDRAKTIKCKSSRLSEYLWTHS